MSRFEVHRASPTVKLSGAPLVPALRRCLRSIVVESQRNLPAMCEVEFLEDENVGVFDHQALRPGAALEVSADAASTEPIQRGTGPLFDGEVVALETGFTRSGGARLLLRGYDRSHRLHRVRRTRAFLNQTDSAVASSVAGKAGLQVRTDPTSTVHEYLCQYNQSDWEFLTDRAREIGYELGMRNGTLSFRRAGADPTAGVPQTLTIGSDLLTFRSRVTSAEQASRTMVHDHDPVLRQNVRGQASMPRDENSVADPMLRAGSLSTPFGTAEEVDAHGSYTLPPHAMARAQARRDHAAGVAFEAEGTCYGNPAMVPGGRIKIRGAGRRFSGDFVLTTVRHVFDAAGEGPVVGFVTRFTISGRQDRSLFGLTRPGAAAGAPPRAGAGLSGPVLADVTNTNDPKQAGRVKVSLPWLAPDVESHWAPVVCVGAGNRKGLQVIPEVGDRVLVVFEHGDARRPYVLGGIYSSQDRMPTPSAQALRDGQTNVRVLRTRAGHVLTFDDTPNQESVSIQSKGGAVVSITDAPSEAIQLRDSSGKNAVTVDGAGRTVTLEAAADLELKAKGRVVIDGKGGLELKTNAQAKLEGTGGVTVKSTGQMNVESPTTTVKGTGMLTLQGGVVKIN